MQRDLFQDFFFVLLNCFTPLAIIGEKPAILEADLDHFQVEAVILSISVEDESGTGAQASQHHPGSPTRGESHEGDHEQQRGSLPGTIGRARAARRVSPGPQGGLFRPVPPRLLAARPEARVVKAGHARSDVLQAENRHADARLRAQQARTDALQARAELLRLIGGLIEAWGVEVY